MSDIVIDKSLNAHLGLPESYQIDKTEAFKLYQYFMAYLESKNPIGVLLLMYYADEHGNFFDNPKNRRDEVVKAIIDNMDVKEKFEILTYINEYPEGYKIDNDDQ